MFYFYDDLFLRHDTGYGHPENPGRLEAVMEYLGRQDGFSKWELLPRRFATKKEILSNHTPALWEKLARLSQSGGGAVDSDTILGPESFDAAHLAAGSGLAAADAVLDPKQNGTSALLLLRPPGHHARRDQAMGFCLFNNIAICARYLKQKGIERIAILDWDVHHGNGTEESFYKDPDVLYISSHQHPCYPGTGQAADTGEGAARGCNLNVPLPPHSGDAEYKRVYENQIFPRLREFAPEFLLISAGFDAHSKDPLAQMQLSSGFFEWVTQGSLEAVAESSRKRCISFLEGGYHHEALAESCELHAAVLQA